jgi:hypothetical protein
MPLRVCVQDDEVARLNGVYTNILKAAGVEYIGERPRQAATSNLPPSPPPPP